MKKTFFATLLILIIATTSAFAVKDSFDVTTKIEGIGLMKVSALEIKDSTAQAYADAKEFGNLGISTSGDQSFFAYLTTLSNNRSGFEVTMLATPMTSTVGSATSYIDYTVECGLDKITTAGATTTTTAVKIIDVDSLAALTGDSQQIRLSVDKTTFDAAVSGEYVGTVTFNYKAT
ncbi:MAG: hypothetical protein RBR15_12845 [Sphaerochaeta sp.]|nr:hypothetical protein [Sphaerochaeta sp.]